MCLCVGAEHAHLETVFCRAFVILAADLQPQSRYRITTGASSGLVSTPFFGSQSLTTREPGTPDSLAFDISSPTITFANVFQDRLSREATSGRQALRVIVEPAVRSPTFCLGAVIHGPRDPCACAPFGPVRQRLRSDASKCKRTCWRSMRNVAAPQPLPCRGSTARGCPVRAPFDSCSTVHTACRH